jgi:hypothetical protein
VFLNENTDFTESTVGWVANHYGIDTLLVAILGDDV